mmetsp:Transcript_20198/g.40224  ORF Transcript_20198/g.40224 Transcript_20198/m.40224 type:complete len:350 (+) Transcript_20198:42-1091(+)
MIVLIDGTSSSLTISWPADSKAKRYVLQYRREIVNESDDGAFETLSRSLTSAQARKRNLSDADGTGFRFRVRSTDADADGDGDDESFHWISHPDPFHLTPTQSEAARMGAPRAAPDGAHAALVSWSGDAASGGPPYELQMRENGAGAAWATVASSLSSSKVRKKNLRAASGYQFRVRPSKGDGVFSPPSDPRPFGGLSTGVQNFFHSLSGGRLRKNGSSASTSLEDALANKEFVLLYASAHWCGPCRQFTPQLAQFYRSVRSSATPDGAEVVFLSADHDEGGFDSYYREMPWLAVPFGEDAREDIMSLIRVRGIPMLTVLDGRNGKILDDNAVGKPLDLNRWRALAKQK